MTAAIVMENVTKRFGSQVAVDGLSLEVPTGCICGLLGENGAGKTTSIRLMLGFDRANVGRVEVLGLDSSRHGFDIRQRVGYVPERWTFYEWMTAAELGWFTAGFYADGFETRYRQELDRLKVPLKTKIKAMSKGTRAKAGLALALAHDPELLILDEPTSGLDTLVRHEFLDGMVDLVAQGRTVLFSSHQIAEVERVADRVAIVRAGRLLVHERLDVLKQQTCEVTLTMHAGYKAIPNVGGQILSATQRGHQWQALVRSSNPGWLSELEQVPGVVAVESRTPSLEEIFVATMKSEPMQVNDTPLRIKEVPPCPAT